MEVAQLKRAKSDKKFQDGFVLDLEICANETDTGKNTPVVCRNFSVGLTLYRLILIFVG
ncbi:MAG: hypothetical protein N3B10_04155 [Armatimonadetes bacterium]|nr:hypothetical protein [Armatimonadota bacterium]MCX7967670.1 hypothetical protein [Armatimonadota bacterium]MDW8144149.1 hypothetical protein [Armatimonadota bacterium]